MFFLVPIILVAWIPIAVMLFSKLPPHRAVIAGVVGATLFLPMGEIQLPFLSWTKLVATPMALFIAAMLMDSKTLLAYRPRLVDLPMLLVCFAPGASAIANNFSPYDALSASANAFAMYALPYFLGRVYLTNVYAVRDMAMGIFWGGLIYAPLCCVEMVTSPQLHMWVYGFYPHPDFSQSIRFGGYRPMMFMQHGLMVGMFMACAALCGFWLWRRGGVSKVGKWPMAYAVPFVALVAVMCKSTGAIVLAGVGVVILLLTRATKKYAFLYALLLAPPIYMTARTVGGWDGSSAVQLANDLISPTHAGSLQVRFDNENILLTRAMERSLLGWGHMGDNLVHDADGRIVSIPDGLWVQQIGKGGLVYLGATFIAFMLPPLFLLRRFPPRLFAHPAFAAPGVLAVIMGLYAIDCLMNSMINPIFLVALGGVGALAVSTNPVPRAAAARTGTFPVVRRVQPA